MRGSPLHYVYYSHASGDDAHPSSCMCIAMFSRNKSLTDEVGMPVLFSGFACGIHATGQDQHSVSDGLCLVEMRPASCRTSTRIEILKGSPSAERSALPGAAGELSETRGRGAGCGPFLLASMVILWSSCLCCIPALVVLHKRWYITSSRHSCIPLSSPTSLSSSDTVSQLP